MAVEGCFMRAIGEFSNKDLWLTRRYGIMLEFLMSGNGSCVWVLLAGFLCTLDDWSGAKCTTDVAGYVLDSKKLAMAIIKFPFFLFPSHKSINFQVCAALCIHFGKHSLISLLLCPRKTTMMTNIRIDREEKNTTREAIAWELIINTVCKNKKIDDFFCK